MDRLVRVGFFALAVGAGAACGGGGGGASGCAVNCSVSAGVSGTGTLVDHESGLPLANEPVALAAWSPGAAAISQGVTSSTGGFSVSASAPGEYLLIIGSDSAGDATRPTIHDAITLTSNAQALVAPTMPAVPDETPNPIEQSGKFRLTTLTSAEAACLTYENEVRAEYDYAPVISDEWLTENNRMNWQRTVDTGEYGGAGVALTDYSDESGGSENCQSVIGNDYTLFQDQLSLSSLVWYAGDAGGAENPSAQELGMFDPRLPLPTPTPPSSWP